MKVKSNRKLAALMLAALTVSLLLSACGPKTPEQTGQIYLYGEIHGTEIVYEKEFELWSDYYHNRGMRHLFIEIPYFEAEYMNLWMQADSDDILEDLSGEINYYEGYINLFKRIKEECPETIFHGMDVGFQYWSTGEHFLEYLESVGQKDSEQYRLAQENMEQGRRFYEAEDGSPQEDWAYREDRMAENFAREIDLLGQADVMGINGGAHVRPGAMDYMTGTVPNMETQFQERYGERVHSEMVADLIVEGYRTDTIEMGGKEYTAEYFGKRFLFDTPDCEYEEYWRLEDAFEDSKDMKRLYAYMAYFMFPMKVEDGQVILVEDTKNNGTKERWFYRADGFTVRGDKLAECFDPDF